MKIEELRELINKNANLPEHIAIIMDGNGRWAKQRSLPRFAGHREGINSVREITRVCGEIGIKHLTLYTFSTENWARPQTEVSALMKLLLTSIRKEINNLHENNVKLTTIGVFQDLPKAARKGIEEGIEITKDNSGLNLNLALSYGSRQEIMQAIKYIAKMVDSGKLKVDDINQEQFENLLYTNNMPDPGFLIRTGGEFRVSNFLLWQIAYTEIYVTDTYWPAFREKEFLKAIVDFQSRERRFGKVTE
ncbi:MAG: isoprenyl transferase [Candidatus Marinimicrobia bacterium]|nr:isoprenyl transferase [Candidatus Neomarinimicrobiota bacterium]